MVVARASDAKAADAAGGHTAAPTTSFVAASTPARDDWPAALAPALAPFGFSPADWGQPSASLQRHNMAFVHNDARVQLAVSGRPEALTALASFGPALLGFGLPPGQLVQIAVGAEPGARLQRLAAVTQALDALRLTRRQVAALARSNSTLGRKAPDKSTPIVRDGFVLRQLRRTFFDVSPLQRSRLMLGLVGLQRFGLCKRAVAEALVRQPVGALATHDLLARVPRLGSEADGSLVLELTLEVVLFYVLMLCTFGAEGRTRENPPPLTTAAAANWPAVFAQRC